MVLRCGPSSIKICFSYELVENEAGIITSRLLAVVPSGVGCTLAAHLCVGVGRGAGRAEALLHEGLDPARSCRNPAGKQQCTGRKPGHCVRSDAEGKKLQVAHNFLLQTPKKRDREREREERAKRERQGQGERERERVRVRGREDLTLAMT